MAFMIALSKILCTKNTGCRYCPKDCQVIYKYQLIDDRNTGHLLCTKLSDHDIIQKAHQVCDRILYDHRQCKCQISLIKFFITNIFSTKIL